MEEFPDCSCCRTQFEGDFVCDTCGEPTCAGCLSFEIDGEDFALSTSVCERCLQRDLDADAVE